MKNQVENFSKLWPTVQSLFSVAHTEKEHLNLVSVLDSLIDEVGDNQDHPLAQMMETIGHLIEVYEEKHYTIDKSSAIDNLKYLMKEHCISQSNLKELGSQGVVSEVLSGKRSLNLEQIKKLSNRFHVSPMVFI